jgi:hypothetical protein
MGKYKWVNTDLYYITKKSTVLAADKRFAARTQKWHEGFDKRQAARTLRYQKSIEKYEQMKKNHAKSRRENTGGMTTRSLV